MRARVCACVCTSTTSYLIFTSQDGKRLYELAREGIHVHREPRALTVYDIRLVDDIVASADTRVSANVVIDKSGGGDIEGCVDSSDNEDITLFNLVTTCSGGTYVRTLVEDIGRACGARAHLNILERTRGKFFCIHIYLLFV